MTLRCNNTAVFHFECLYLESYGIGKLQEYCPVIIILILCMIKIVIPCINQVQGTERWFEPPSELPVKVKPFVICIMLAKEPYPEIICEIVIQG